jgi:hypothetical protein
MSGSDSELPSEREIERVVTQLRDIDQRSTWDRVLEVGRVVFDGLVGGNEAEWHSRRGRKNVSLRKLVQHPRCPFRKTALSTAVGVHLFTRDNPGVRRMAGLSPTHVAQVLAVQTDIAMPLLNKAVDGKWSVRELGQHVKLLRREAGERRGRPPASMGRRLVTLGRRAADNLRQLRERLLASATLDEASQDALLTIFEDAGAVLAELSNLPAVTGRPSVVVARPRALPLSKPKAAAG